MQAGSAKVDITPTSPCHLAGYAARDHGHTSVHDPLSLRALYVSSGETDALLVTADIIWFTEDILDRITPLLSEQLDLDPKHIVFAGSHTHSAPVPRGRPENRDWVQRLEDQALSAAALAKSRLTSAAIRSARGTSDIGVNRREVAEDGRIILGINPDGPCDKELIVTEFADETGSTIATIGNFACHGTTLSQRNYELSGDWSGVASIAIEESRRAPFLYLNGGAANICPRIDRQESFEPVDALASEFAADYNRTFGKLQDDGTDATIVGLDRHVLLPRKHRDIEDGKGRNAKVRIQGLRIGPLRILTFPGEVFSQTAEALKSQFDSTLVMVCSYASGGSAGYVPVREAYDTGGYEVRVSPYSEEAEAVLRSEFTALLEALS